MGAIDLKIGKTVFGINWVKVQDELNPDYIIQYTILKSTANSVTVRWTEADGELKRSTFFWKDRFHKTKEEAHAYVRKWLVQEIEKQTKERDRQIGKLERLLARIPV